MATNPKWERNRRYGRAANTPAQRRYNRWFWRHPDKWTDYPILLLGDDPYKKVPIRKVEKIEGDHEKWVFITVDGATTETKRGYIYGSPRRAR